MTWYNHVVLLIFLYKVFENPDQEGGRDAFIRRNHMQHGATDCRNEASKNESIYETLNTNEHDVFSDFVKAGIDRMIDHSQYESVDQSHPLSKFLRGQLTDCHYVIEIVVSLIVVVITSHFINLSTVLDSWDFHPDTYLRWYGRKYPTSSQYGAFGVAAFFNIIAMLCLYLSLRTWFTRVRQ